MFDGQCFARRTQASTKRTGRITPTRYDLAYKETYSSTTLYELQVAIVTEHKGVTS